METTTVTEGVGPAATEVDIGAAVDAIVKERGDAASAGTEAKPAEGAAPAQAAPAAAPAEVKPAAPAEGAPAAPAAVEATGHKAPDTWTAASKEKFATLPPDIQAEVVKREADYARGIGEYKGRAGVGDRFAQMMTPYMPMIQNLKADPWTLVPAVLNAYGVMVSGKPEEKAEMFRILAQDAGIDLTKLGEPGAAAATSREAALLQRVNELEGQVTGVTRSIQGSQMANLEKSVVAFAEAKDASGELLRPYFDQVAGRVAKLLDSGAAADLADAYSIAVWTDPVLQAKELSRHAASERTKEAREAAEKVEKAQRATAARVKSSETAGGHSSAPPGSVDQTLVETLAAIRSRG